jgi:hypothetical protein
VKGYKAKPAKRRRYMRENRHKLPGITQDVLVPPEWKGASTCKVFST